MIKIYKLIYNNEIVYVGKTKFKLTRRIQLGYSTNVEKILKDCSIELIEETTDVSRERYWIEKLRSEGHTLLNKLKGDGLDRKEYYQNNKEKNREYKKEYLKKYYQKNKEDINLKRKEYQEKNIENIKEYKKEWYLQRKKLKINNE